MSPLILLLATLPQVIFAKGDGGYDTFRIPAIVQAANGDLLAFAEARKNGPGDTGDIDLVMRRSRDLGENWEEMTVVWEDGENVCGNPSPVVDRATGRIVMACTWNDGRDPEKAIHARTSIDTRRVFLLTSDDNGETWSPAREITASAKDPEWTWYATGPCHAIQLRRGPHKGRIIVPCDHGVFGTVSSSHVIYSDDGGETWQIGGTVERGNESTVCELRRGKIMLNMRDTRKRKDPTDPYRRVAVSRDGGVTFSGAHKDTALTEPVCQGSILSEPNGRVVYFCNPASTIRRTDMTVRRSRNGGRTWTSSIALPGTFAAYSDICLLGKGKLGVLYETGEKTAYDTIVFTTVTF